MIRFDKLTLKAQEAVQTAQLDGEIKDRAAALELLQRLEPSIPTAVIERLSRR